MRQKKIKYFKNIDAPYQNQSILIKRAKNTRRKSPKTRHLKNIPGVTPIIKRNKKSIKTLSLQNTINTRLQYPPGKEFS